jgi:hypothetical protein
VNLEAAVGQVEGGLHPADAAADDEDRTALAGG